MHLLQNFDRPVSVIGCGYMGQALARGFLKAGLCPTLLSLFDPAYDAQSDKRDPMPDFLGQKLAPKTPIALVEGLVILAVKPARIADVLALLSPYPKARDVVYLSVAAGVSTRTMANWIAAGQQKEQCQNFPAEGGKAPLDAPSPLDEANSASCKNQNSAQTCVQEPPNPAITLVRAMPNIGASVGQSMTALYSDPISSENRQAVTHLLEAVGLTIWLERETEIDAATAVAGSGPAYFYAFVEALCQAGIAVGLSPKAAEKMARQTFLGAAALLADCPDKNASDLRREVTSPQGTTAAGLAVLQAMMREPQLPENIAQGEKQALSQLVQKTVAAAFARAQALAK